MVVYWPGGQRFLRSSSLRTLRAFETARSIHASGKRCFSYSRSFRLRTRPVLRHLRPRRTVRRILYTEPADTLGGKKTLSTVLLLSPASICLRWVYWKRCSMCYWIAGPAVGIETRFSESSDRSMVAQILGSRPARPAPCHQQFIVRYSESFHWMIRSVPGISSPIPAASVQQDISRHSSGIMRRFL